LPAATSAASTSHSAPPQSKAKDAKKRADLKVKTSTSKSKQSGQRDDADGGAGVLGGADYVSLLMGGRRKAKEEAEKLPQDED
jgi:hypothetical protein